MKIITHLLKKSNIKQILITFILMFYSIFSFSQFTPDKPDLRLCGDPPNYYLDYYNCVSSNYTLNQVFLSLTNVNGVPLTNTTCIPGSTQPMYIMLNYTSNSNSNIENARIFADLTITHNNVETIIPLNVNLGTVTPGQGQRFIYGPFNWVCGDGLMLSNILVVWKTSGSPTELVPYDCSSYGKSQCDFSDNTVISTPLAVQFDYTGCTVGNQATITFNNTTNGGIPPYTYAWDFTNNGSTDSTLANPVFVYTLPGPYTAKLTVTDSNTTPLVSTYIQIINPPQPLNLSALLTPLGCSNSNNAAINLSVSGGTPGYTYSWSNGASTEDISGLAAGTYTVTVTDSVGCQKTESYIISGGDTSAPVVTAPNDYTIEGCSEAIIAVLPYSSTEVIISLAQFNAAGGTVTDNSSNLILSYIDTKLGTCPIVVTRTFYAKDECNNTGSDTQTISIDDSTLPTASNPTPITLSGCNGTFPAPNIAVVTNEADNCGTPVVAFVSDGAPNLVGCIATTIRTYSVTDACGNSINVTQNLIRTVDTTLPTASSPAPITLSGCNGTFPAPSIAVVTDETDNCGTPVVAFVSDGAPNLVGCTETTIRTYSVTDACNNSINVTQNLIRTVDTTLPTASNPAPITLSGCNGTFPAASIAVVTDEADNCGTPVVAFVSDGAPNLVGCMETTIRTYSVTDACGNTINVNQNLIRTVDTALPTASNPAPITLSGCNGTFPAPSIAVVTNEADNCGTPIVAFVSDGAPNLVGCTETTIRTYSVTDACGNTINVNQNLIRTVDTTLPTASNPAPITLSGCNGTFPAPSIAVVTNEADNCGTPVVAFVSDGAPNLVGCKETTIRTYSVTDACNNSINVTQNLIRTVDTTLPTASNPAPITLSGCNGTFPAPSIAVVTNEADNCGTPIVAFVSDGAPNLVGCTETTIRTYSVTDACGNTINVTQSLIRTVDTTLPTASNPAPITLSGCNGTFPAPSIAVVTNEADNCGTPTVAFVSDGAPNLVGCTETTIRTYSVTDACGNTINVTQNLIRTVDTALPTASNPAPITLSGCNGTFPAPSIAVVTNEADNCGTPVVAFVSDGTPNLVGCTETTIRTYSVTDACNNSINVTQNLIRTVDTTPPTASNPAPITLSGCNGTFPAPSIAVVINEADNCGTPTVAFVSDGTPNLVGCMETTIRTYSVTDACNNSINVTQNLIRTVDTTPPTASNPAPITLSGCNGTFPAASIAVVINEADNCGTPTVAFVSDGAPNLVGCTETIIRTYSVTDACGNTINVTQNLIRTVDTALPTASNPAPITLSGCNGTFPAPSIAVVTNEADNCGTPTVAFVSDGAPNLVGCTETIIRTYSVTDACNNSINVTQNLIRTVDTALPTASNPTPITLSGCNGTFPAPSTAVVTDEADNCVTPVVAFLNDGVPNLVGCTETTIRTYSVTDACNNSINVTQNLIRTVDTTLPTASNPAPITLSGCNGTFPTPSISVVTNEADNCGTPVVAFVSDGAPNLVGCMETTIRTYSVTDACGNSINVTQNLMRTVDITPPAINIQASNITVQCDGQGNQSAIANWLANNGGAVATDLCGAIIWSNNYSSITNDCSAAVTVTFTATDSCGNFSTTSATFNVNDTIDPNIITSADNITVECDGLGNTVALQSWLASNGGASASDDCSAVSWSNNFNGITNTCGLSGFVSVIFTATDSCGNNSSSTGVFTIQDTTSPIFTIPANVTIFTNATCTYDASAAITGEVIGEADICSTGIQATYADTILPGACQGSYIITRTWSLIDSCGNEAPNQAQTITVLDNSAPTFTIPANMTVFTDAMCAYNATVIVTGDVIDEADNCSTGIQATYVDAIVPGECLGSYIITRTWSLVDYCGNAAPDQVQTITVLDNIAPTFTIPANTTVFTDSTCVYDASIIVTGDVTDEADNCSAGIQATYIDTIVPGECLGSYIVTRTWSLVDNCSNAAPDQVQTITVLDNIAPTFTVPSNMTVFTDEACTFDASIGVAGDVIDEADNCSTGIQATFVDVTDSGECQGSYIITRTWSLIDSCGNEALNQVQTITVLDNLAPTFTIPANMTVFTDVTCAYDATVIITGDVIDEADNCSTGIQATYVDAIVPGECLGFYIITRTWSLVDYCGNAAPDQVQTITVLDNIAPTFTIPENITIYSDSNCPYDVSVTVTGDVADEADNCSTGLQATYVDTIAPGECEGSYIITRTWSLIDNCQNPALDQIQTISIQDNIAPILTNPISSEITVNCDEIPIVPILEFTDSCSNPIIPAFDETLPAYNPDGSGYIIIRTWTAADSCDNQTIISQTVNVIIQRHLIEISAEACNGDSSPIDLNSLIASDVDYVAGGIWTDLSNSGGLNDTNDGIFSPFGIPVGSYTLEYQMNDQLCSRKIQVNMSVNTDCIVLACGNIIVHNAFSPNNDGFNEVFTIENIDDIACYPTNRVEIYNRWGILVYEADGYDNNTKAFRGISEGRSTVNQSKELPTGTYFYILQYSTTEGTVVKESKYLYLSR